MMAELILPERDLTAQPKVAAADARRMQPLRTRDASDHLAMYQAGFYATSDRQTGEFCWDRRDERYIVQLGPSVSGKARHILKKEVWVPVT